MENENKWEYDYSASNNETGYPNVGSSGMNTANTARTDYSAGSSTNNTGANTYNQPNNAYGQNNGYTSSFSGSNGGYNGYSYASAPQQPPKKEKKHNKVLLRVLAGVGVVALGFGSGIGGAGHTPINQRESVR